MLPTSSLDGPNPDSADRPASAESANRADRPARTFRWLWLALGVMLLLGGTALLLDRLPAAALLFDPAKHLPRELTAFGIIALGGFWIGALFGCPYAYHVPTICPLCERVFQPGEARLNHCPDCRVPLPLPEALKELRAGETAETDDGPEEPQTPPDAGEPKQDRDDYSTK